MNNLGVQQVPMLFSSRRTLDTDGVEEFVEGLESSMDLWRTNFDIVVKPTHLCFSDGTLVLNNETWYSDWNADLLVDHMKTHMAAKAHSSESAALQSAVPGILIQPRYDSCINFDCPIEVRVITLWGKVRMGIWWFGDGKCNKADGPEEKRNAWFVEDESRQ